VMSSVSPLGSNNGNPSILEALEANHRRTMEHQERAVRSAMGDFMLISYESLLKEHLLLAHPVDCAESAELPKPVAPHSGRRQVSTKLLAVASKPTKPTTPRRTNSGRNLRDVTPSMPTAAVAAPTAPKRAHVLKATKASNHRIKEFASFIEQEALARARLILAEEGEYALIVAAPPEPSRLKRIGSMGSTSSLGGDGRPPRQPSFTSLKRRGSVTPRGGKELTPSALPLMTAPNGSAMSIKEQLRSVESLLQRRSSK
jgi:hypothetical protein